MRVSILSCTTRALEARSSKSSLTLHVAKTCLNCRNGECRDAVLHNASSSSTFFQVKLGKPFYKQTLLICRNREYGLLPFCFSSTIIKSQALVTSTCLVQVCKRGQLQSRAHPISYKTVFTRHAFQSLAVQCLSQGMVELHYSQGRILKNRIVL